MDTKKDENVENLTSDLEKREKRCKIYALVGFVVLILAIAAFYFLYFIKTPVYSLNEIRTAAQTKNVVLLEERADLKSIYSNAFDDYVSLSGNDTGAGNPLIVLMAKLMKPTVVDTFVEKTKEAVKNGDFAKDRKKAKETAEVKTKDAGSKEVVKNENNNPQTKKIKDFKLKGVKDTIIAGNTAVVSAEVLDEKKDKVIIVDFKMKKLNDGTWQLVKIDNFKDILKEIDVPSFNELVNK